MPRRFCLDNGFNLVARKHRRWCFGDLEALMRDLLHKKGFSKIQYVLGRRLHSGYLVKCPQSIVTKQVRKK